MMYGNASLLKLHDHIIYYQFGDLGHCCHDFVHKLSPPNQNVRLVLMYAPPYILMCFNEK